MCGLDLPSPCIGDCASCTDIRSCPCFGQVKRRIRSLQHAKHCPMALAEAAASFSVFETAVEVDDHIGIRPETRCGLCCLNRLRTLAKHDGRTGGDMPALPRPVASARFSWEKNAKAMKQNADGTYDGSGWFDKVSADNKGMNTYFQSWGGRMNARRHRIDPNSAKIPLHLFHTHCMRHGCVLNLKRAGVTADEGAAHVCMTRLMWDNVYGQEDAVAVGERITPGAVGRSAGGAACSACDDDE